MPRKTPRNWWSSFLAGSLSEVLDSIGKKRLGLLKAPIKAKQKKQELPWFK